MRFLFLFVLLFSFSSIAQKTRLEATISADDLPEGLGKALIFSKADSSMVKGTYVDSSYLSIPFDGRLGKEYYLKLVIPGYRDTTINFTVQDTLVSLGTISLGLSLELDAVNVVYEKPVFERTMNGISVNVKGTTLEELNTLFDILKASPRLSSPDDESIEIIGRGAPLILIDRQAIMSNDELKAVPASEVDRIEILTNPSAKYRAQGSGNGVIEVYTTNFSLQGYKAHIRADGGVNTQLKPQAGLNLGLNVKKNKFSLNGYLGTSRSYSYSYGKSEALSNDSSVNRFSDYEGNRQNQWQYYKLKMGYDLKEGHRLSFGVGGHGSTGESDNYSIMSYYANGVHSTDSEGTNKSSYKWLRSTVFTNYSWDTDTLGSVLEVNLNYSRRVSDTENEFENVFRDQVNGTSSDYNARATSVDRPHIGELRINYEHHFDTTDCKLEFGVDLSLLYNKKRFNRYELSNQDWVEDPLYTNSYDYQEQIGGAFLQFSRKWNKFGFQVGIRGEYTRLDGYSHSLEKQFMDSSYLLPFPNAGLLFELNENVSITAFYEAGIDRPSFTNYDPFVRILDSLNVEYGNPYLRPAYEHTVGMEFDLFFKYNLSISYSRYNNMASTLTFWNPNTFVTTQTPWNADYNEMYSLSASVPIELKWVSGWNSLWIDYNKYVFTNVFERAPYSNISFGFQSYLTFELPYDFNIMAQIFLNKWGDDVSTSNTNRNFSIRLTKEFKKPDLNIFGEVSQIFPNKNSSSGVNGNYTSYSESQNNFTGFRLGIFYKFGRLKASTNIKESESGQSGRF